LRFLILKTVSFLKTPLSIIIIAVFSYYLLYYLPNIYSNEWYSLPYDTLRDISYVTHILNGGHILSDPSIAGAMIWYPPLNPLIVAFISKITNLSAFAVYEISPVIINSFLPIFFYLSGKKVFGTKVSFIATILLPIGFWFNNSLLSKGMPSTHGVVFVFIILYYFIDVIKADWPLRKSILLGFMVGLALLNHSLSGLLIFGTILVYIFIDFIFFNNEKIKSWFFIVLLPILIFGPYFFPNLISQKLNMAPLEYNDIWHIDRAFFFPTFFISFITIPLFFIGLVCSLKSVRKNKEIIPFLILLFVSFLGQVVGFLREIGNKYPDNYSYLQKIPILIPHEFQWFFHCFILFFISYGLVKLVHIFNINFKYTNIMLVLFSILIAFPSYIKVVDGTFKEKTNMYAPPHFTKWIKENSNINDVFITSNEGISYFYIQPYSGRKVFILPKAHINFNVDYDYRFEKNKLFFESENIKEILSVINEFDLNYLLIDVREVTKETHSIFLKNFSLMYKNDFFEIFELKS
tara:strand:- start:329 stop:1888 length:1560 start_codon:yes stop_codon:yes gene_type:complete